MKIICIVPKPRLLFGVLVYPKHQMLPQIKERYPLKEGITVIIETLDLSKDSTEAFDKECNRFVKVIRELIKKEILGLTITS